MALTENIDSGVESPVAGRSTSLTATQGTTAAVPPPGLYLARLELVASRMTSRGTVGRELTFRIVHGQQSGYEISEVLWTKSPDEPREKQIQKQRVMMHFAEALGAIRIETNPPGPNGEPAKSKIVDIDGKLDWLDVVGAEVVIKVKHEEYESETSPRLTYMGIWPLDASQPQIVKFIKQIRK